MDCLYFRLFVVERFILFLSVLQNVGVGIGLPSRISVIVGYCGTGQFKYRGYHIYYILLLGFHGTTLAAANFNQMMIDHFYGSQVGGGLYQSGDVIAHADNAVWTGIQRADQFLGSFFIDHFRRDWDRLELYVEPGIGVFVFFLHLSKKCVEFYPDIFLVFLFYAQ